MEKPKSSHLIELVRTGNASAKRKGLDELSHILAPYHGTYHGTSAQGACFAWGSASNFQLGETWAFLNKDKNKVSRVPELAADVSAVVTSKFHTVVLTSGGAVYTSGFGVGGRLGLRSHESQSLFHPVVALNGLRVTCVAVSDNHTLAVTSTGSVFGWGCNKSGQLGLAVTGKKDDFEEVELVPRRVTELKKVHILSAAAAPEHSVLLARDGAVWTFGNNSSAQLGHLLLDPCCHLPKRVECIRPRLASAVSAAANYSAIACCAQSGKQGAPGIFLLGMGKASVRVTLPYAASQWAQMMALCPLIEVHAQNDRTWLLLGGHLAVVEHTHTHVSASPTAEVRTLGTKGMIPRCARGKHISALSAPPKGRALAVTSAGVVFELVHTSLTHSKDSKESKEAYRMSKETGGHALWGEASSKSNLSASPSSYPPPSLSPGSSWDSSPSPHSGQSNTLNQGLVLAQRERPDAHTPLTPHTPKAPHTPHTTHPLTPTSPSSSLWPSPCEDSFMRDRVLAEGREATDFEMVLRDNRALTEP
jgi:hypothetical protein